MYTVINVNITAALYISNLLRVNQTVSSKGKKHKYIFSI